VHAGGFDVSSLEDLQQFVVLVGHVCQFGVDLGEFGSTRAMFGTNLPVETLWTSAAELTDAWRLALSERTGDEQADVFSRTARRVYGLGDADA
jgi:hypothetical protein